MIKLCFENQIISGCNKGIPFVDFDNNFSQDEAEIFIKSLLEFNDASLNSDFITTLSRKEETALPGGLHFVEGEKNIYPGCCSEFNEWPEVIQNISQGINPWMGHDPEPFVKFSGEFFTVFSDKNKSKNNIISIKYETTAIGQYVTNIEAVIPKCINTICAWASINSSVDTEKLKTSLNDYLFENTGYRDRDGHR